MNLLHWVVYNHFLFSSNVLWYCNIIWNIFYWKYCSLNCLFADPGPLNVFFSLLQLSSSWPHIVNSPRYRHHFFWCSCFTEICVPLTFFLVYDTYLYIGAGNIFFNFDNKGNICMLEYIEVNKRE